MNTEGNRRAGGKRVLLVDDDGLVVAMVEQMVTNLGYDVIGTARDGTVALDLVLRLNPDVVLMDLVMPRMDGLEAAQRIQEMAPTPVVLLTAYNPPALCDITEITGVVACLSKPPDERQLARALDKALAHD